MIKSLQDFKEFVIALLRLIVQKGDSQAADLQAKIQKLSDDLATANTMIGGLKVAVDQADADKATALANQAIQYLSELDTLSSELAAEFNPTPVADAVAEAVEELPQIETPEEVSNSPEIGTSEPTPETVLDAALEAVEASYEEYYEAVEGKE